MPWNWHNDNRSEKQNDSLGSCFFLVLPLSFSSHLQLISDSPHPYIAGRLRFTTVGIYFSPVNNVCYFFLPFHPFIPQAFWLLIRKITFTLHPPKSHICHCTRKAIPSSSHRARFKYCSSNRLECEVPD